MDNAYTQRVLVLRVRMIVFVLFCSISLGHLTVAGDAKVVEAKKETVKEAYDLNNVSLENVAKWDIAACNELMSVVRTRKNVIKREKMNLYVDENRVKVAARKRADLPDKYKQLADDIAQMKKDIDEKVVELGTYMNTLDEVKDLRQQMKNFGREWSRLVVMEDAVRRRKTVLEKSKRKGAVSEKNG